MVLVILNSNRRFKIEKKQIEHKNVYLSNIQFVFSFLYFDFPFQHNLIPSKSIGKKMHQEHQNFIKSQIKSFY